MSNVHYEKDKQGIVRPYSWRDVKRLQGKTKVKHTLAENGAAQFRSLMKQSAVRTLGAMTGNQAVQMVKAGLKAVYVSGWQVAADANSSGQTYPDQSLYPVDSVPSLVKRINNALLRAEQIDVLENGENAKSWMVPVVADAEAGFGGSLNAYELVRSLVEAGVAGIHLEDQLASQKKCGHLGGKVLVPTNQFIQTLVAARLACDVQEVDTVLIARTDADSAQLITNDIDSRDVMFIDRSQGRTIEGFWRLTGSGIDRAVERALAYAPYADVLWFETSTPDISQAKEFSDRVHEKFPGKLLAYNCSPSFHWGKFLSSEQISSFQWNLENMGYAFQFVTLCGFHANASSMYKIAADYEKRGMSAYVDLQVEEFRLEIQGYEGVKHQRASGTSYFDAVANVISSGTSSTLAMAGSTEEAQFRAHSL